jgi:hypothetical protein
MTLEEAWAEFQETAGEGGTHVGTLEAMQLLRETARGMPRARSRKQGTPEEEEQVRFFDWLLHVKQEKTLAYELLRRLGTITVGTRQYWTTKQGERRAIAWESVYTYPGTDSEIWDVILVD